MFDKSFGNFRKVFESSLQMQQDMFKHWANQWVAAQPNAYGASPEWSQSFQKSWARLGIELLNKHRELLDSAYKAGIEVLEQGVRLSEAGSPEDRRRGAEELWRKVFELSKTQSQTQFNVFQKWAEKSFELAQNAAP